MTFQEVSNVLTKEQVIDKLKKVKHFLEEENKKNSLKELDDDTIKKIYNSNLQIINKELGLNLKYEEDDVLLLLNVKNGVPSKNVLSFSRSYDSIEAMDMLKEIYEENKAVSRISFGCGLSLVGNFVSTLGLSACATGVGCPVAIAAKAISLACVAEACL